MTRPKWLVIAAASNLALAVGLGAFGAHALRDVISPQAMEWFKTGHSYHMWHGLGLLTVLALPVTGKVARNLGLLMLAGTVFFSGSLYLMSVTEMRWLGAITPIGGVSWIAGWVILAVVLGKGAGEQK